MSFTAPSYSHHSLKSLTVISCLRNSKVTAFEKRKYFHNHVGTVYPVPFLGISLSRDTSWDVTFQMAFFSYRLSPSYLLPNLGKVVLNLKVNPRPSLFSVLQSSVQWLSYKSCPRLYVQTCPRLYVLDLKAKRHTSFLSGLSNFEKFYCLIKNRFYGRYSLLGIAYPQ